MFPRRRSRARQVRLSLPRGRKLDIVLPKPLANRLPSGGTRPRPQAAAALIAGIGAGLASLAGLVLRRRNATRAEGTPAAPAAHGVAGSGSERGSVTPAVQPPTSDREPDEIERLAKLNSTQRAGSQRR
jgi:hypothetical protein